MDFLKSSKRRSLISDIIYKALNVGLAVVLLAVVLAVNSPALAFGLFILSKWRVLAVRPIYWFSNIQANLVDVIVGISFIVLLYAAAGTLVLQIVLTALYIVWLLFIKPRSKRSYVAVQAGVAVFLGVSALMNSSYNWYASVVVILMWLIGYSAARHVLGSYDETQKSFLSLVWGALFAELGWLMFHWSFAYELPGLSGILLSQGAILALVLSFFAERMYASYHKHNAIHSGDIVLPALLSVSVVVVILVFFNSLSNGAI